MVEQLYNFCQFPGSKNHWEEKNFLNFFCSINVFKKGDFCQILASKIYDKIWHCFNIFCNSENLGMSPVIWNSGIYEWTTCIYNLLPGRKWYLGSLVYGSIVYIPMVFLNRPSSKGYQDLTPFIHILLSSETYHGGYECQWDMITLETC